MSLVAAFSHETHDFRPMSTRLDSTRYERLTDADNHHMCKRLRHVSIRGTGEQSFLRTESDFSSGGSNNEKSTNNANAEGAAAGKEEEAGEGSPRSAPWVVSKTPGSDVLEEMLLARVFGA